MSSMAPPDTADVLMGQSERLDGFFAELAELAGQRNAIDGRIAEIAAEIDKARLWGFTGVKSMEGLIAWKLGTSRRNAETIVAVARRMTEFPRCSGGLREGRLSLDQVGAIAEGAGKGSDAHYAELAAHSTVSQLRTAIKQEPRPEPEPEPSPEPEPEPDVVPDRGGLGSISKTSDGEFTCGRIRLAAPEAAKFEAALHSHHEALIAQWKHDSDGAGVGRPPMPAAIDGFMELVDAGWDAEAARRPHGQHTTVVVHVDVKDRIAALHLGPALSVEQRRYLSCDATCEVWFERDGQVIGSGRTTRTISRRLRRALEYRDRSCVVPGCGATKGLHAHHLQHWEDGGPTDLDNLVLICPFHHRLHHRGGITLTGPADQLVVTDQRGRTLEPGSLARPPTQPPPEVRPYRGPSGERIQWKWYHPYQPEPPTSN
ncbi:DUF222 domain-containing protein [Mycobacterium sp. ITM-2016-00317]|uniref:HNH endonuclease signature motif containing protein n=1 Tax=Mycobacterium sp. ITM-2016-00317 TaxID=2099694 RepID=UPI000D4A3D25|nr:HNH endonuclease signature motif containing protein [Mycobacterium sp. ITM-2016-00317]WNG85461.1 DUF222 domain-containing protein [Mycobacterium sp. ITM-2016-00317]